MRRLPAQASSGCRITREEPATPAE